MTGLRALLLGACGVSLLWGDQAFAAETGAIETVVVTAEKRAEDVQTVPIVIQAFTSKQISDLGIHSSVDLGQFSPNLDVALVAGQGNQPIIAIRGVGLNDFNTNNAGPNGIYVDEVYLSAPGSQTFQTFDLESIQVVKGPQGTLFGRNSSGGAILFTSAKPSDDWQVHAHVEYGAYDTLNAEVGIGGPIADGLDFRISAVKNNSGGFSRNLLTGTRENGANNEAGRAQLQYKPNDDLTILLNFHGGSVANRPNEYRHIGDLTAAGFGTPICSAAATLAGDCVDLFGYGTPTKFYDGEWNRRQHLDVHNWGGFLKGDWTAHGWMAQPITFTSISAFEHNDKLHPEDSDASPNRLLEIDFGVRSETFTQELRASQQGETYTWVTGIYYLEENLHQNQPLRLFQDYDLFFGPGSGDFIAEVAQDQSRQITNSYAAYGQGSWDFAENFKLTFGARFTGESKSFLYQQTAQVQSGGINNYTAPVFTFPAPGFFNKLANTSFNWKGALDYQFTDKIMAYASISTGFKSGGFNGGFIGSLGIPPTPSENAAALQAIKPERVRAYEVGEKATFFDDRLLIDAAAFYNDYRDEQVFVLTPVPTPPPVGVILLNLLTNAPKAHTTGLDLTVTGKPTDDLTISSSLGLLQAKVDSAFTGQTPEGVPISFHGHQLVLSPHVTSSTTVDYHLPAWDGSFDFQFNANFKSLQYFDLSNVQVASQRPYWLENARIAYDFEDNHWEVAGFIRNLAGQKYLLDTFDLTAPFGFIQGIMGNPRTFGVELNLNY